MNISPAEGARLCHMPRQTFHQVATGLRLPRGETLRKLVDGSGGQITADAIYKVHAEAASRARGDDRRVAA